MRILLPAILAAGLALPGCALYFGEDSDSDGGVPSDPTDCPLPSLSTEPGFPFDVERYEQEIWPVTQQLCGLAGCHAPGSRESYGFTVWPSDGDPCSMPRSFGSLIRFYDLSGVPENSRVLAALDGRLPHPLVLGAASPEYGLLLDYVVQALETLNPPDDPFPFQFFDFDVFQFYVQPMFDEASCTVSGCHDRGAGASLFPLHAFPALDSAEMMDNFVTATNVVRLDAADAFETALYQLATNQHGGVAIADPVTLEIWIEDALARFRQ